MESSIGRVRAFNQHRARGRQRRERARRGDESKEARQRRLLRAAFAWRTAHLPARDET